MSDVRKAAEGLAQYQQAIQTLGWPSLHAADKGAIEAGFKLARDYLAQHPADEDEPVTEEWLESVGWQRDPGVSIWTTRFLSGPMLEWFPQDETKCVGLRLGVYWLHEMKTRGQIRRIMAALGVPLKEGR